MRLAVVVALVVNLVTACVLAFGLAATTAACTGPACTASAAIFLAGLAGVVIGLVAWWRGDPRPLLVVDLALMGLGWVLQAAGLIVIAAVGWAVVPFGDSIWLACGIFALGRLWLDRSAPGPAPAAEVDPSTIAPSAPRPTTTAGATRVAALMEALDRMPADGVRMLVVRPLDPAAHESARDHALARATEAGRAAELVAGRTAVETWVRRWLSENAFDPTFVAIAWRHEPLGPEERMRLIETLEDAALGLIAADLVDETISDELLGPCAILVDPAAAGG